ncbi:MAG: DUF3857 domain-containing protein, partial [Candidatus Omnitrophota bacterium]|nr:DUF3857 domain-containing protein [Candidatus Omnitrophota bacterium]
MRTIDTISKSQATSHKSQVNHPYFYLVVLPFAFLLFTFLAGCAKEDALQQAQADLRRSDAYYQRAAGSYQELIKSGKGLDRAYLALGELYLSRGEFPRAAEAFQHCDLAQGKKMLAITYFRQGDFTDALEVFNQLKSLDEETLYYQGITREKLNLFDAALESYRKIKGAQFGPQAAERIRKIEKYSQGVLLENIDPWANGIVAAAPAQENYPQAGALILYCGEKIEVTPQNSEVSELHYLIKILNERGKGDYSETHIDYDVTYEKIELLYARTIKPDGTVADVGTRHIRDVSKYLNFPLYSNARVFIISFPEVSAGAVIEYKLRIRRSELINKKDFIAAYPLQAKDPVMT